LPPSPPGAPAPPIAEKVALTAPYGTVQLLWPVVANVID
jgi:hypothetical protein